MAQAVSTGTLVRERDYWTLVYDGRELRLRDSKGIGHLARLLAEPGRELAALALAADAPAERTSPAAAAQAGLTVARDSDAGAQPWCGAGARGEVGCPAARPRRASCRPVLASGAWARLASGFRSLGEESCDLFCPFAG
jgi:hypothetical protein